MTYVGSRNPVTPELTGRRSMSDLLWVANTRHGPGGHWFARPGPDDPPHDHLATPADATRYLADHRVDVPTELPTAAVLADLAVLRDMVRGLVDPAAGWTDDARARAARARFRIDPDGSLRAAGAGAGWRTFVDDLVPALVEVVRLRDRLRVCGNPLCRLVFLDGSRSGTRRWCDDAGCGNRDRVRRHRHLRGEGTPSVAADATA